MSDSEEDEYTDLRELYQDPILTRISAVGGIEAIKLSDGSVTQEYKLGDECLGCLKDLKKFWRKDDDDPNRTVARILHQSNLVNNDLLPILSITVNRGDLGDRIALAATDLISCLTWPILISEEFKELVEREEEDRVDNFEYTSFIQAQQSYKLLIVKNKSVKHLLELLLPRLAKSRLERNQRDEQVIALILHTFRNILAIKDSDDHPNLHSELIEQLHSFEILTLFNTLASSSDSRELIPYNIIVLEIFSFLYRSVNAEELTLDPTTASSTGLLNLLNVENKQKQLKSRSNTSRHSRFGTTVSVLSGSNRFVQSRQSAITSAGDDSMDIGKRKAFKRSKDQDNSVDVYLSNAARKHLKELADIFLETSFDTFFSTLLKDFRMERPKVREGDKSRWFMLSAFFLQYFNVYWRSKDISNMSEKVLEEKFGLISTMVDSTTIGYISARMKLTIDDKPPSWKELHCAINCLIQVLYLVDLMVNCKQAPGLVDVAENLQDKLYYNGDVMEVIVNVMSKYKDQSVQYLNSIIHLSYLFLRMLEKFSKSKAYMFVRKRKRTTQRNDEDEGGPTMQTDDLDDPELIKETPSAAEHKFVFSSYERRFANENIVKTCLSFLERHLEFKSLDQLKYVVNLLYRQAVRAEREELFFKVSTLHLFRNIQEQVLKSAVNSHSGPYKDLMKLIEFIVKRFFKAAAENKMLFVEALFPVRSKNKKVDDIEPENGGYEEGNVSDENNGLDKDFAENGLTGKNTKKKRSKTKGRIRRDDKEKNIRHEQMENYLSAKFIEDSDEDENSLQDFYKKEEELRKRMNEIAQNVEVPTESMSLLARKRRAKEAEKQKTSLNVLNEQNDSLQNESLFEDEQNDLQESANDIIPNENYKSQENKRKRVIESDEDE